MDCETNFLSIVDFSKTKVVVMSVKSSFLLSKTFWKRPPLPKMGGPFFSEKKDDISSLSIASLRYFPTHPRVSGTHFVRLPMSNPTIFKSQPKIRAQLCGIQDFVLRN